MLFICKKKENEQKEDLFPDTPSLKWLNMAV